MILSQNRRLERLDAILHHLNKLKLKSHNLCELPAQNSNLSSNILVSYWYVGSVKTEYASIPDNLFYPVIVVVWRGGGYVNT